MFLEEVQARREIECGSRLLPSSRDLLERSSCMRVGGKAKIGDEMSVWDWDSRSGMYLEQVQDQDVFRTRMSSILT